MYVRTHVRTDRRRMNILRIPINVSWPSDRKDELDKVKKLAGHDNFSKLVRNLLLEWLDRQERTLQNNPIGLRYETPDSKHWIDTISEIDISKIKEDVSLIESQELVSKLKRVSYTISKCADERSMELWKMNKVVVFKE